MNKRFRKAILKSVVLSLLLVLLLPYSAIASEGPAANREQAWRWTGSIDIAGTALNIEVDITAGPAGELIGTLSIPDQGAMNIPLDDIAMDGNGISFAVAVLPGAPSFAGEMAEDGSIAGTYTQSGQTFPFALVLVQDQPPEPPVIDAGLDSLAGLDEYIEGVMADWAVPGTAVAVVQDGQVVYAKGFGLRNTEAELQVTTETQFGIGSTTKAFTTTLIGMLVDEGLLDWDAPIKNYIPGFELNDQLASDRVTLRDLVTHRTGLPRHDLALIYNPELTREGIVNSLHSIEATQGFRSSWQYNNYGYIVAGYVMEQVTGKSWEELVAERIFAPLGMTDSSLDTVALTSDTDYAEAYTTGQQGWKVADLWEIGAAGPAGSINSNVLEMANWVSFQLSGQVEGQRLLSPVQLSMMRTPHIPSAAMLNDPSVMFSSYGLGWMLESYRGNYLVHHGGNVPGYTAMVGMLPSKNAGVVVLSNMSSTPVPILVTYNVVDRLLGLEQLDHNKQTKEAVAAAAEIAKQQVEAANNQKANKQKPGLTAEVLQAYTGTFEHPLYGKVSIKLVDDKLVANYYKLDMELVHQNNAAFNGVTPEWPIPIPFHFQRSFAGEVEQVLIGFEPTAKPLSFVRCVEVEPLDPAVLKQLPGTYEVMGVQFTIKLEGEELLFIGPGQPPLTLKHTSGAKFDLAGFTGYSVEFLLSTKGKVTGLKLIQPNGSFDGKRL